ncbi:MAG: MoaD/ThiS family protein [Desulforhabdus sp.]|jgi:molybdopterin converting factor small subunit|nr:MoaD/ThiS family protein [Desulforhabdus sp.]
MPLQVLLAATLRKCFPGYDHATGLEVQIEPGTTVRQLAERLQLPLDDVKLILVNGQAAKLDTVLEGTERVAMFPPVGGG